MLWTSELGARMMIGAVNAATTAVYGKVVELLMNPQNMIQVMTYTMDPATYSWKHGDREQSEASQTKLPPAKGESLLTLDSDTTT
jgi:hypothetical protein